jgi:hypothetical protein
VSPTAGSLHAGGQPVHAHRLARCSHLHQAFPHVGQGGRGGRSRGRRRPRPSGWRTRSSSRAAGPTTTRLPGAGRVSARGWSTSRPRWLSATAPDDSSSPALLGPSRRTCRCTLTRTSPPAYHVSVVSWSPAVTLTVALTSDKGRCRLTRGWRSCGYARSPKGESALEVVVATRRSRRGGFHCYRGERGLVS